MIEPPTLAEIREAAGRLRDVVVPTPLVPLHSFDHRLDILLKPEIHQAVTSFKIRGVFNAVAALQPEERAKGLSTVSAGNTAQALAWVGRHFGVSARSIMPDTAPAKAMVAADSTRVENSFFIWASLSGSRRVQRGIFVILPPCGTSCDDLAGDISCRDTIVAPIATATLQVVIPPGVP